MAKVEVFEAELDTWFPGTLEACGNDSVEVSFPDNWKPRTSYPHDRVRLAAPVVPGFVPREQEKVEALTRVHETHALSWFPAVVTKVEANKFVYVQYADGFDEILEISRVRPVSTEPHVSPKLFTRVEIKIPDNLVELCRKEGEHNSFRDQCGLTSITVSTDGHHLILTGSKDATEKGVLLASIHFRRLTEVKRLEDLRQLVESHTQHTAAFTDTLPLQADLIGLAIGKQGANILAARAVPGVLRVDIVEDAGNHNIIIQGHTKEAVAEARDLMEFCTEQVSVARADVAFVIGKEYHSLEEIIERSGVANIQSPRNSEASHGTFEIVGRRSNVNKAKLLIHATLDLLHESRQLTQETLALSAQLRNFGISPSGYSRGRGRGRGGARRGGAAAGGRGGFAGASAQSSPARGVAAAGPATAAAAEAPVSAAKAGNFSITIADGARVVSATATSSKSPAGNKGPKAGTATAPAAPAAAPTAPANGNTEDHTNGPKVTNKRTPVKEAAAANGPAPVAVPAALAAAAEAGEIQD
eukprot:m.142631 g.142631  ORF g.142631 m.142631 type:complete len:529 (+) comp14974_c15_seq12:41-1627(+)